MKKLYEQFCLENKIPIFLKPWWMDASAGPNNWDVIVIKDNKSILGVMPYFKESKFGFNFIKMPPLTQFNGPYLNFNEVKKSEKYSFEIKVLKEILRKIPKSTKFSQCWHYSSKNWLPFYWQGYQQTTKYSYYLNYENSIEMIWDNLKSNIKSDIKKAKNRFNLTIHKEPNIYDFIELNKLVFLRQGKKLPYKEELIENIYSACLKNNSGKLFLAKDPEGRIHAGALIIWDEESAYYLLGGSDPELRNSGATSFCLWEAIKFFKDKTKKFDFEGSMIQPVEKFVRAFGAKQVEFYKVEKQSKFYRFFHSLKNLY